MDCVKMESVQIKEEFPELQLVPFTVECSGLTSLPIKQELCEMQCDSSQPEVSEIKAEHSELEIPQTEEPLSVKQEVLETDRIKQEPPEVEFEHMGPGKEESEDLKPNIPELEPVRLRECSVVLERICVRERGAVEEGSPNSTPGGGKEDERSQSECSLAAVRSGGVPPSPREMTLRRSACAEQPTHRTPQLLKVMDLPAIYHRLQLNCTQISKLCSPQTRIRYLESLLKVYSDEIQKLQEKELELEDLQDEDSSYIQEHRLKRKMMKIYEKLCELKGCSAQTGRVIEQRIQYSGTRYPEINKRVERFINNPSQSGAFPDYSDILHVMTRASEKHQLGLGRKQLQSLAQDAFRDVGNRLQERRHLDLVYNFGSHLTDQYSARADPALSDPSLSKKLHSNRALALSSIDQVITKYAAFQDEMEEQERNRRIEREKEKKEKEGEGTSGAQVKRRHTHIYTL
ncbi:DAXX protein, partial [Polyodon spathula]|nr:DAXX protein [Polyodon spathula]